MLNAVNYHCHLNVSWKTGTYIYLYNAALVVIVALTASWFKRSVLVMHLIANKARVLINLYYEDWAVARFVGWFQVIIIVLSLVLILVLKLPCYVYSLYMFFLLLLKDAKTVQFFFLLPPFYVDINGICMHIDVHLCIYLYKDVCTKVYFGDWDKTTD